MDGVRKAEIRDSDVAREYYFVWTWILICDFLKDPQQRAF